MRLPLILSLSCLYGVAFAGSNWFTVAGNPEDPGADTVQVDPLTHGSDGTLQIRISRATQRSNWEGVPYRSYTAEVAFDCAAGQARYHGIHFHALPLWRGEPHHEADYRSGPARMMEFRDMQPNPTARLVAAACNPVPRKPTSTR